LVLFGIQNRTYCLDKVPVAISPNLDRECEDLQILVCVPIASNATFGKAFSEAISWIAARVFSEYKMWGKRVLVKDNKNREVIGVHATLDLTRYFTNPS
jgi:hypothetical protein